jgi:hypothetical protein
MHLRAVIVLKPIPEGGGCVAVVMAKLLPNVARTGSPTGRTEEFGIVIPGLKRKPSGTGRGKTNSRPNAKSLSSTMGNPGKSTSLMFVPLMALCLSFSIRISIS